MQSFHAKLVQLSFPNHKIELFHAKLVQLSFSNHNMQLTNCETRWLKMFASKAQLELYYHKIPPFIQVFFE